MGKHAELAKEIAKKFIEAVKDNGVEGKLAREILLDAGVKSFREDVVLSDNVVTKILSKTVIAPAYDQVKEIIDLCVTFDELKRNGGANAIKIPKLIPAATAYKIEEGEVVQTWDLSTDSILLEPRKLALGTRITWEFRNFTLTTILNFLGKSIANALMRELGKQILNTAVTAAENAGNVITGGISYDNLMLAIRKIKEAYVTDAEGNKLPLGLTPKVIVLSPEGEYLLTTSTDWKQQIVFTNTAVNGKVSVNRVIGYFYNIPILVTPLLEGAQAIVMDTDYALAYAPFADIETYEQPIQGRPYDKELVMLMVYDVKVMAVEAIQVIKA